MSPLLFFTHTCVDRPHLPCDACDWGQLARPYRLSAGTLRATRERQLRKTRRAEWIRLERPKNLSWCPQSYLDEVQSFLESTFLDPLPIVRFPCGLTADLEYHVDTARKVVTLLNPQVLTQHPQPLQAHLLRELAFERCGYKVEIRGSSLQ